jgi:hypothetical protein
MRWLKTLLFIVTLTASGIGAAADPETSSYSGPKSRLSSTTHTYTMVWVNNPGPISFLPQPLTFQNLTSLERRTWIAHAPALKPFRRPLWCAMIWEKSRSPKSAVMWPSARSVTS